MRLRASILTLVFAGSSCAQRAAHVATPDASSPVTSVAGENQPALPLRLIAEVDLPGKATRFDYQDIDQANGHLVIAHMNDNALLVVNLADGALVKTFPNMPTVRGVVVASDVNAIFATVAPNQVVIIDSVKLSETKRVTTGTSPDGIAWDDTHKIIGVSDQGDGALSLLTESGLGRRIQIKLGAETGNVVFDKVRSVFWITVVPSAGADKLVAVDPVSAKVVNTLALPGCTGAHGLRIHPGGNSAYIACEGNSTLARIELEGAHAITTAKTGAGPDVLAIDPSLGWLYIASESGDLDIFDLRQPGLAGVGKEMPGKNAHTLAVDAVSHHVFLPLPEGSKGSPVLRILSPVR
jgi:DNA-binding beta-propeller fold protein YncE